MNRPATSNHQLISRLPTDINDHVLAYLLKDYKDIETLSQVCKNWKDRFISPKIFQLLKYIDNTGNSSTPQIAIAADVPEILERQILAINEGKKAALEKAEDNQKAQIKKKFEQKKQELFDNTLWQASNFGSTGIATLILKMQPYIRKTDKYYLAERNAILKGHCELANLLIDNSSFTDTYSLPLYKDGANFFNLAVRSKKLEMLKLIINKFNTLMHLRNVYTRPQSMLETGMPDDKPRADYFIFFELKPAYFEHSAMREAMQLKLYDMIEYMIKNIEFSGTFRFEIGTPLLQAVKFDDPNIIAILLQSLSQKYPNYLARMLILGTPLDSAYELQNQKILHMLIGTISSLSNYRFNLCNLLMIALENEDYNIFDQIIFALNEMSRSDSLNCLICELISKDKLDKVKLVLSKYMSYINLNHIINNIYNDYYENCSYNPYSKHSTPLFTALNPLDGKPVNASLIQYLIKYGADTKTKDLDGQTLIHKMIYQHEVDEAQDCTKNIESIINLLKIDINAQDIDGMTPLHYSIHRGCIHYARMLLSLGANPNIQDNQGRTALHHVIARKDSNKIEEDFDTETESIYTYNIHSNCSSLDFVELLLQNNCDHTIKDNNGQTALDLALQEDVTQYINDEQQEIIDHLKKCQG